MVGGELWRPQTSAPAVPHDNATEADPIAWARALTTDWFTPAELSLKQSRHARASENVLKFRADDGWNVKASWMGRVKSLLVEVGVSVNPVAGGAAKLGTQGGAADNGVKRWTGNVGVSIAYST